LRCLIPQRHVPRIIYFNPGDPDYVPLWNPLKNSSGHNDGRVADDLVGSIKIVMKDWGDRLEHVMRNAILPILPTQD